MTTSAELQNRVLDMLLDNSNESGVSGVRMFIGQYDGNTVGPLIVQNASIGHRYLDASLWDRRDEHVGQKLWVWGADVIVDDVNWKDDPIEIMLITEQDDSVDPVVAIDLHEFDCGVALNNSDAPKYMKITTAAHSLVEANNSIYFG